LLRKFMGWYYKKRGKVSPVRTIVLAFASIVLIGTFLLMLPCAAASGTGSDFLTALFTATSATCVTGLVITETGLYWSSFGQAVIICLIQIGGLGFMTLVSVFFFLSGRKLGLKERMIIAQSYSMNSLSGVVSLVKKAAAWTFSAEMIGAIVLSLRFMSDMPLGRAVWCGVFHSVSAFCNAGFDILAMTDVGGSLAGYATDLTVNVMIMLLILCGGTGFFVLDDIASKRKWKKLSLYSKLAILTNIILVFGGAFCIAVLEWDRVPTFRDLSAGEKILASLFQSVTTRTAGFYTIPQGVLSDATLAVSDVLMFFGGASGSTAGGAKTVTMCVLILSVLSAMQGKSRVFVFGRSISKEQIRDAMCLVFLMFTLILFGAVFISATNDVSMSHAFFETTSALCTVGLSTGLTPALNTVSKLILIAFMFFGRVGIMTFSLAFLLGTKADQTYVFAEEKILIG